MANRIMTEMAIRGPSLTLDAPVQGMEPVLVGNTEIATLAEESKLTPEELAKVKEFSKKIDIKNPHQVMQFGASTQKNIASFSESTLKTVRTKDMGEVGQMLSGLMGELSKVGSSGDGKGILSVFKKGKNKVKALKAKYAKVSANIDAIASMLEKHRVKLFNDAAMLERMFELNNVYYKELSMYIIAGKNKLVECNEVELPILQQRAAETNHPSDIQAVNDFMNMINRFEKKLHDLELTRAMSLQLAPQIRMLQNNDALVAEKINTSLVNTIPLWKTQMVMAFGMNNAQEALSSQREVTDMTNSLLVKNAEMLKLGTIEIAKESERGIIDLETLDATNRYLLETIEEVRAVQAEGQQQRRNAETELVRIEQELKQNLLAAVSAPPPLPSA